MTPSGTCRGQCEESGEPLLGSAGDAAVHVGVAWPKPLWNSREPSRSTGFPDEVASALAKVDGVALRLFQREAEAPAKGGATEVIVAGPSGAYRVPALPLRSLAPLLERAARGEPLAAAEPLGHEIHVCTDGKRDRCCAEAGFALYQELASLAASRAGRVRIAQSSHLGGHRFAANCLVLPSREVYGRVRMERARELLDAVEGERVPADLFRGRLGDEELLQIAEGWLWSSGIAGPKAIQILERGQEFARLEVRLGSERWLLHCARRAFVCPSSCGKGPEVQNRWVVEGAA